MKKANSSQRKNKKFLIKVLFFNKKSSVFKNLSFFLAYNNYKEEKNTYQQPQPQASVHTSVKVHNPPGGKSNITFG